MKKLILTAVAMFAVLGSVNAGASGEGILKAHKCPKGQHWDSGMKMCMPN